MKAQSPADGSFEEKPKPCCTALRCKSMAYRPDERPGMLHQEEAMGYWCSKTSEEIGPDGKQADHQDCQEGRSCFKAGVNFNLR